MMVMSPINEEAYDKAATQIVYCKLYPLLLEDFVSRLDAKQMMLPNNLPFTSQVVITPGQAVQVVVPAGTGSTVSPGKGDGFGTVKPIYDGSARHPSNGPMIKAKEAIKDAGGQVTTSVLDVALGG